MFILLIALISIMILSLRLSMSGVELLSEVYKKDCSSLPERNKVLPRVLSAGVIVGNNGIKLLVFALKMIRAMLLFMSVAYYSLYIIFIGVIGMGATGAFSLFFEKDAAYTEIGNSSNSVDNSFGGIDTVDFSEIKNESQKKLLKEIMESWGSDVTKDRVELIMKGASRIGRSSYSMYDTRRGGSSDKQSIFDCSSFVGWTFNKSVDKSIPTSTVTSSYIDSSDVAKKFKRISADEMIPGDVVLAKDTLKLYGANHIGIYVGKNKKGQNMYLHCTSSGINGAQITTHGWEVFLRYKGFDKND